jgi:hypothetical protein
MYCQRWLVTWWTAELQRTILRVILLIRGLAGWLYCGCLVEMHGWGMNTSSRPCTGNDSSITMGDDDEVKLMRTNALRSDSSHSPALSVSPIAVPGRVIAGKTSRGT